GEKNEPWLSPDEEAQRTTPKEQQHTHAKDSGHERQLCGQKPSAVTVLPAFGHGGQEGKPDMTPNKEEHTHQMQPCTKILQEVLHHWCSCARPRCPCKIPSTVTMISIMAMPIATRLTVVATCAARQASSARCAPPTVAGGTIWVWASQVATVPSWYDCSIFQT